MDLGRALVCEIMRRVYGDLCERLPSGLTDIARSKRLQVAYIYFLFPEGIPTCLAFA